MLRIKLDRIALGLLLAGSFFLVACDDITPYNGEGVALFINDTLVDYDETYEDTGSEASNIELALEAMEVDTVTFTGTEAADVMAAVEGRAALVLPEPEAGELDEIEAVTYSSTFSAGAKSSIAQFVLSGGLLIVFPDYSSGEDVPAFLNELFGWSLVMLEDEGVDIDDVLIEVPSADYELNVDAAEGTSFASGPATLPANNGTMLVVASSLPAGAVSLYDDADGTDSALAVIGVGEAGGAVVIVGWDWYDGAPNGEQDGGWLDVLEAAVEY